MNAYKLSISEVTGKIRENELSPLDLLESILNRVDKFEPILEAWVNINRDGAIKIAERYTREAEAGTLRGPLHGVPIGVKDIFYTKGLKTTACSKILAEFTPSYDATTVTRLKEAGAIILGKTETTEFAYADPPNTRNPWNIDHTPGGSSSGSAAAVSSGMCPAALGTQTGGSTIRPASYCGIFGMKPTYGRISRYGIIPRSWSMDHDGIFTRNVEDSALLLQILAGHDPKDPTSSTQPILKYGHALEDTSPPRLGLIKEFFHDNAHQDVKKNLEDVNKKLMDSGAEILEVHLPKIFDAVHPAQRIIGTTEGAAYHEKIFKTKMMDYRPKIRGLIASGLLVPAAVYLKSQRIRSQFIREITEILKPYDCFLTPSATMPAPKGLKSTGSSAFNSPWSFRGFPSITIPSGLTKDGLPLGIQLVGRPFDESRVLGIAKWCDKIIKFDNRPRDKIPYSHSIK